MKKLAIPLLAVILSSCTATFGSFKIVYSDTRDEVISSYFKALNEYKIKMPSSFTYSSSIRKGVEEDRNPLFGSIIYKTTNMLLEYEITYSESNYSYHYKESSYLFIEAKEEGEKDTSTKIVTTKDVYINNLTLVSKEVITKDGKESEKKEESTDYKTLNDAKDAFLDFSKDYVYEEFSDNCSLFYDYLEAIPSKYNEAQKDIYDYHVYTRTGFEGDFKIDLTKYVNEEKNIATEYYLAQTNNYLPYYYRGINRKISGGGNQVYEFLMSLK